MAAAAHNQLALLGEAEVGGSVGGQQAELQVRGQKSEAATTCGASRSLHHVVVTVEILSDLVYPMITDTVAGIPSHNALLMMSSGAQRKESGSFSCSFVSCGQ